MDPNVNPSHGLAIALIIIILVYAFATLWSGVHLLKDPTIAAPPAPKPTQPPDSQVQFKCKNGYLYFVVNGEEQRASSTIPNVCAEELNNANISRADKDH